MIKEVLIKKIKDFGEEISLKSDVLAVEEPLEISLKTGNTGIISPISVTMRTPGNDEELAVGFLFTEGIIFSGNDLDQPVSTSSGENKITVHLNPRFDAELQKLKRNFYTSSSCGVCGKESIEAIKQVCRIPKIKTDIKVELQHIFTYPDQLRKVQETFDSTGGIHASAFFNVEGKLTEMREDVGRHNALDKLIGAEFLKSTSDEFFLQDKILLLSGRASFELIQKSAMAGIQVVCAIGAPSSLAVETAVNFGITLIGFLKNGNANIYCGAENIQL